MQSLRLAVFLSLIAAYIAAPLIPYPDEEGNTGEESVFGEDDDLQSYEYTYEEDTESEESLEVSERLSGPNAAIPKHYVLSKATSNFVAITKSARVNANAQLGKLVAQFVLFRQQIDGREHIALRSVRYESRGWYLTIRPNGNVRGGVPSDGNEIFEIISLPQSTVALKLRRVPEGSGDTSNTEDCFLGFSATNGRPSCYISVNHFETHLQFLAVTS